MRPPLAPFLANISRRVLADALAKLDGAGATCRAPGTTLGRLSAFNETATSQSGVRLVADTKINFLLSTDSNDSRESG